MAWIVAVLADHRCGALVAKVLPGESSPEGQACQGELPNAVITGQNYSCTYELRRSPVDGLPHQEEMLITNDLPTASSQDGKFAVKGSENDAEGHSGNATPGSDQNKNIYSMSTSYGPVM